MSLRLQNQRTSAACTSCSSSCFRVATTPLAASAADACAKICSQGGNKEDEAKCGEVHFRQQGRRLHNGAVSTTLARTADAV